jgi:hypothetical protein
MTSDSASRVTRSSRSLRLALVLFGCCLAVGTVLRAQETVAEEEEKTTTESTEGTEADDVKEAETPAAEVQERKPGVVGPTPGRFEPTEKVRADFDVSFPVDI